VDFLGLTASEWFFLFIEFPLHNKYLSYLNSAFKIFVCTQTHTWFKLEVNKLFSIREPSTRSARVLVPIVEKGI